MPMGRRILAKLGLYTLLYYHSIRIRSLLPTQRERLSSPFNFPALPKFTLLSSTYQYIHAVTQLCIVLYSSIYIQICLGALQSTVLYILVTRPSISIGKRGGAQKIIRYVKQLSGTNRYLEYISATQTSQRYSNVHRLVHPKLLHKNTPQLYCTYYYTIKQSFFFEFTKCETKNRIQNVIFDRCSEDARGRPLEASRRWMPTKEPLIYLTSTYE